MTRGAEQDAAAIGPGAFVAVVGASGVGKDALLQYAAGRLGDAGPLFVRRVITRPAGPGEEHLAVSADEFAAAESAGAFAVVWRAHGTAYGIPADVDVQIQRGGAVVANVSRAALAGLARRYADLRVVRITVSPELRAARLARRGREDAEGVAQRLARPDPAPDFPVDLDLVNDGGIEEAGEVLAEFLRATRSARAS